MNRLHASLRDAYRLRFARFAPYRPKISTYA